MNAASLAARADAIASGERPPKYKKSKAEMLDPMHLGEGIVAALKAAGVRSRLSDNGHGAAAVKIQRSTDKPPTAKKAIDAVRAVAVSGKLGLKFTESTSTPGVFEWNDEKSYARYPAVASIVVTTGDRWDESPLDASVLRGPASALGIYVDVEQERK